MPLKVNEQLFSESFSDLHHLLYIYFIIFSRTLLFENEIKLLIKIAIPQTGLSTAIQLQINST
jgi:hypothetical protein